MTDEDGEVSAAARNAAENLRRDSMTAAVLEAFESAGVECVLLKGPSIVRWLYAEDLSRSYSDTDLLVNPADWTRAEQVLREDGFAPMLEEVEMPSWWREHGAPWQHPDSGHVVDLHRTLPGVGVEDDEAWSILSEDRVELAVGGRCVPGLSIPARALHLALHAAQHRGAPGAAMRDLDRAIELVDRATWEKAAESAGRLQATAWMGAGLRQCTAGQVLAAQLELDDADPVDIQLRTAMGGTEALTLDRIMRARTLRERGSIVWHKLFPPPTFMRHWSPLARRGRSGLALAYLRRLAWILARAGPAVLAWSRARRRVRTH